MAKFPNIAEIKSDLFDYDEKTRTFSTFASDLTQEQKPGRIYDDAMDFGFYLVSARTGQKLLFVSEGDYYEQGTGDRLYETFSAYCPRENPDHLMDLKLKVFND